MAMNLFEHNAAAYQAAVTMLSEHGKACVIHPTGTGKSFIGFKLCEDNPDKTICWLSPSDYIFQTQIENLKETSDGYYPDNIRYYTYARLMNMSEDELVEIKPDYIVLDEFHRCGAEFWGKGVERLLSMYADVPMLGLSATAIRYLDNQRNMADELFDGNIVSEMTLGEAIVRGILNPPKYVLSIFSYKESLVKYEIKVRNTRNKAVRDKAEQYLEALRRALDKAQGLDVIFHKHMTDRTGKYIVFCSNFEAMQDAMGKVDDWFHFVDPNPHIYSVYSLDASTNKQFDEFKNDNDPDHLKLLFCIDALNEGVHVENISGVILLRPTTSPIIYKQQIGRALSASKTTVPVIFDVVNNIENLYSIDSIKEEMQSAIRYFREYDRDTEIVNDEFDVIDEVRECVELFNELEGTLTASWEIMFAEAKRYYEENGDLLIPDTYVNENGYRIGRWVGVQRRNYQAGQGLTQVQIQKMESIGICWESRDDRFWNERYEICKTYFAEHQSLSGIADHDKNTGNWLIRQRRKYRDGELEQDRIDKLTALGMIWNLDEVWERYFDAAQKYYAKFGDLDIPIKYVTDDGLNLGQWYRTVRKAYQDKTLSQDRIERLEAIGMQWKSVIIRKWLKKYELAREYFKKHGDLNIKLGYICEDGTKLGSWISTQREHYFKGILTEEQVTLLEQIGMSWQRFDDKWNKAFNAVLNFVDNGGDINNVPTELIVNDINISAWLHSQRNKYKNGKLSRESIEQLENLGIIWEMKDSKWEQAYFSAHVYFMEHHNLNVPQKYICDNGFKLGIWLSNQRTRYRTGKLSAEKIEKLENIGMIWNKDDLHFEDEISHVKDYLQEHGDLDIPKDYVCADGYRLGAWLRTARQNYRCGEMSQRKILALEELGIVWEPKANAWNTAYSRSKTYYDEHNCSPVASYICDDGFRLGLWVFRQKQKIKNNQLNAQQVNLLNQIGIR